MEPLQQGGMSPAVVLRLCSTFPYVGSRKQKPRNVGEIEENLERSTEYNALTQKKLKIGAANRHCQPRLRKSPCLGGRSASPCSCWCRPRSRPHRDQSGEMRNCVFFFLEDWSDFLGVMITVRIFGGDLVRHSRSESRLSSSSLSSSPSSSFPFLGVWLRLAGYEPNHI